MTKTTMHEYKSDPQSGAGNCTCGQAERHRDHFHKFVKALSSKNKCTCGYEEAATVHMDMVWINDHEVMAKSILDVMWVKNKND